MDGRNIPVFALKPSTTYKTFETEPSFVKFVYDRRIKGM